MYRITTSYVRKSIQGNVCVYTVARALSNKFDVLFEHPQYNDGKLIIIAVCDTEDKAIEAHNQTFAMLTSDNLPEWIYDVETFQAFQRKD